VFAAATPEGEASRAGGEEAEAAEASKLGWASLRTEKIMYYGAHAAPTEASALYQLMLSVAKRVREQPPPEGCSVARFPVALLFVRGDRAGDGKNLAEQAVASFDYWDKETGDFIDLIMAGWSRDDDGLHFNRDEFLAFRRVIEEGSTWEYSGETDLLLLNFDLDLEEVDGWFNYSQVIVLPLEAMLREKHIGSLDGFVAELVTLARKVGHSARHSGDSPVWEISDRAGVLRAKKDIWHAIKKLILRDYADKLNALENFAVRDLQRDLSPYLTLPLERMQEIRYILRGFSDAPNQGPQADG
jgi:hypothetical protein